MFIATDTRERRHEKIRSFLPGEPVIAILLAAVDFEWTVRRAIIALGTNTNRVIRDKVLNRCHGPDDYKKAWKAEVVPQVDRGLAQVVPRWAFVRGEAFQLRHQVVHGLNGLPSSRKTSERVEAFLQGSEAIDTLAREHGVQLFGKRLPVRRKPRAGKSTTKAAKK